MPDEGWRGYLDALAGIVPLNARVFARNVFRDEDDVVSLINAGDFSEEEIKEIYRRIDFQNKKNELDERRYRELIPYYEKHLDEYPKIPQGIASIRRGMDSTLETMPDGQFVETSESAIMDDHYSAVAGLGPISDEERYELNLDRFNKDTQSRIDDAKRALESYEKDRSKTSVGYYSNPNPIDVSYYGPGFLDTIDRSFTSPRYNINTTLGQFNAFENEDGTITIKDTYDWGGSGSSNLYGDVRKDDPYSRAIEKWKAGDMGILDLLPWVGASIRRPEVAGNVLMRTLLEGKSSPVEFTLPPRVENIREPSRKDSPLDLLLWERLIE